jgi:hypothetical protein
LPGTRNDRLDIARSCREQTTRTRRGDATGGAFGMHDDGEHPAFKPFQVLGCGARSHAFATRS